MSESSTISNLRNLIDLPTLELKARRIVEGVTAGRNRSSRHGLSTEFSEHRNYVPGDDLRHIDWKVYGRSDRFFLKQYADETSAQLVILLDCSRSMNFQSSNAAVSKWGYASLLSAALFWMGIQQNHSVGLQCFSSASVVELAPAASAGQFAKFQQAVESSQPDGPTDFGKLANWLPDRIGKRKIVFVISDFFDETDSLARLFQRLDFDHHDVSAIQLYDPAESEGPDLRSDYIDPETGNKLAIDADRIRTSYQKVFSQFQANLKAIWARSHVAGVMASTSSNPAGVLRELFDRRDGRTRGI